MNRERSRLLYGRSANISKKEDKQDQSHNSKRQKCAIYQVPYWGHTNFRCHLTKFSRKGNLAPGICARLFYDIGIFVWRGWGRSRNLMILGRLPVGYVNAESFGGSEDDLGLLVTGKVRSVVAIFKYRMFAELIKQYSHFTERKDSLVCT
jgi:hypothetical protein